MSSILVLLALVTFVYSSPAFLVYDQQNAAIASDNPWQYNKLKSESFQEQWKKFWNNLVNQRNSIQSQIPWTIPPNGAAAPPPGFQGSWTWVGSGPPNVAFGTAVQSGYNALAGTNLNSGVNDLARANSQSVSNALSFANSNLGIQRTQTSYNQQASQATSGTNTYRGTNIHQGINTHQGTNTGPSNYNGPLWGSSLTVNTPKRQPVFIQGAISNTGNAGSIYVPGN